MAISEIWYAQSNHLSENTIAERRYVIGKVCQALRVTSLRNASITYQVSWFGFFSLTSRGHPSCFCPSIFFGSAAGAPQNRRNDENVRTPIWTWTLSLPPVWDGRWTARRQEIAMADSSGGEQDRRRKKKVKRGERESFTRRSLWWRRKKGRGDGLLSYTMTSSSIARNPCWGLIILTCLYIAHMCRHNISINGVK